MYKKLIIVLIAMLSLVFLFVFVHEFGHFVVAKQYGLNPSMHFFRTSEETENNSFFSRGIAYTSYISKAGENSEVIERKILFAGLWFEMILLAIISGIVMIITLNREDWLLFVLTSGIFAVTLSVVFEWNLLSPIYASDLYYILMGV